MYVIHPIYCMYKYCMYVTRGSDAPLNMTWTGSDRRSDFQSKT